MSSSSTPVLFLIFNRPQPTRRVFEAIRMAKPSLLFIAADGPRSSHSDDANRCVETREVVNQIDWDCEVKVLLREKNLGCKVAVSEAITWFFEHVESGIILEDDCLPAPSFFRYCTTLLEKFRYDERIMQISGMNLKGNWKRAEADYFYSYYGGIWGWATWKRAWNLYDVNMSDWGSAWSKSAIKNILGNDLQASSRILLFDSVFKGEIDTWDYQWSYCRLKNSGMSIVPSVNLVKNIGFGPDATHTTTKNTFSDMSTSDLTFPLRDNPFVVVDRQYDKEFFLHGVSSSIRRLVYRYKA
jgi:hypothetical protein